MPILESQLRQFYRLLNHKDSWSQLHCHDTKTGKVVSRELVYGEEKVVEWANRFNGKGNCFIGRAPRNKDGSVERTLCLSLDIDPQKEKGTAASQGQFEAAIQAGRSIVRALSYGVLCSSGNGALVLFPLRTPLDKENGEAMGKRLEEVARLHLTGGLLSGVTVDSTWDLPRLAKLIGTISTKGDADNWRQARFLDNGTTSFTTYEAFMERICTPVANVAGSSTFAIPDLQKGELDRSKADISLANRLKIQGFTAEDAYKSLCLYATRAGREDDYRRIIQKVYYDKGNIGELVSGRGGSTPIQLWTPANGLHEYTNRKQPGEPELPTGFGAIDRATFGLVRGSIFTVGARTNCGKTSFAVTVAAHLCGLSKRVLFMSTETQYGEIWDRYIAASTGIPANRIQHGLMSQTDVACFNAFIEVFKQQQLFVYDGSRPSIHKVREAIEQTSPDVLVFDYFQHVEGRETKELEEFVMALRDLAKETQVAVLICAMLHDGLVNPKTNKLYPPSMGNMKNCKVLNDESRVVALLDWDRDQVAGDGPAAVKVLLAKNKGSRQDCLLKLDRSIPRFENDLR